MTNPTAPTRTGHRNTDISCAHPAPDQADTTPYSKIAAYALGIPITGYFAAMGFMSFLVDHGWHA